MEPVTIATLAAFLAPFFQEAGKTLAAESVKLALEKREDIKHPNRNRLDYFLRWVKRK